MPRKSRRSKQKHKRIIAGAPVTQPRPDRVSSSIARQSFPSREATMVAQFVQRYQYAIRDVRRTFIVAAICVAVLVGVYFLLN